MIFHLLTYCLIVGQVALADPGVWDQMQKGEVSPSEGVIKNVDASGMDVVVTIETKDEHGKTMTETRKLCPPESSVKWPDLVQASMVRAKRDELEEKKKAKATIHYGNSGPFNTCFTFVK